jgi:hypothetical protein
MVFRNSKLVEWLPIKKDSKVFILGKDTNHFAESFLAKGCGVVTSETFDEKTMDMESYHLILCYKMIKESGFWSRLFGILILITSFSQTVAFNDWGVLWFSLYRLVDMTYLEERNSLKKEKHD